MTTVVNGGYTYVVFKDSTSIQLNHSAVDYVIIGGGGAGGNSHGGGGGAGGIVTGSLNAGKDTYSVVVGSGGDSASGDNSSMFGVTALGGGRGGGGDSGNASDGGSGGGGSGYVTSTTGGTAIGSGLGNNGGNGFKDGGDGGAGGGGGGGGSGSVGSTAPVGGGTSCSGGVGGNGTTTLSTWISVISSIMPTNWNAATSEGYIGGGGGGGSWGNPVVSGGSGGGGTGGTNNGSSGFITPTNGINYTGSGGGGGGSGAQLGAPGGSGLVIIRYIEYTCFKEGSKILTNKGYVPVEQLRKGDLIKTYLHHYLPIVLIGKSTIYNSGDNNRVKNRLYTLPKSELPLLSEDLILTGCHSLLVDGLYHGQIEDMAGSSGRLYKIDDKLRLFTCFEPKAIPYPEEGFFTIYHFALECDDDQINFGVWANGLLVETSSIICLRDYSNMEFIE